MNASCSKPGNDMAFNWLNEITTRDVISVAMNRESMISLLKKIC